MLARSLGLGVVVLCLAPAIASAQLSGNGTIPGVGSIMPQSKQISYGAPAEEKTIPDSETGVSFIDSALPQTQVRILIDGNYGNRSPARAEYLFPRSGIAGGPGWLQPE